MEGVIKTITIYKICDKKDPLFQRLQKEKEDLSTEKIVKVSLKEVAPKLKFFRQEISLTEQQYNFLEKVNLNFYSSFCSYFSKQNNNSLEITISSTNLSERMVILEIIQSLRTSED